jgi:hypothetical protein
MKKYYDAYRFLIDQHGEEIVVKLIAILHKEGVDKAVEIAEKGFTQQQKRQFSKDFSTFFRGFLEFVAAMKKYN